MQHSTRNRPFARAGALLSCTLACALGVCAGPACASPAVAFAAPAQEAAADDGDAAVVDQPFGQIIRIVPGRGMSALLYLPALPVSDEEGNGPGALESLLIERSDAEDPGTWENVGTLTWDEDCREYATEDSLITLRPVYADDQWTTVAHCVVQYCDPDVDYRDFYLRATAVCREDGGQAVLAFAPALIEYPQDAKPDADGEAPDVVVPPVVPAGESGGNRGGIGQGESQRVDPESAPQPLPSAPESAYANEPSAADEPAADGDAGTDAGSDAEPQGDADDRQADGPEGESAPAAPKERDVPGFAWAIGLSGLAVALGAVGAAIARQVRAKGGRRRL